MFSIFSVLVTSLCPRKASVPIASREDLRCTSTNFFGRPRGPVGSNRLARLCAGATGHTSQQPEATISIDQGRSSASLSSSYPLTGSTQVHPTRIECHLSAISPAVEPLSGAEPVTVNPQPYFVPSTASASEILTNVAVQYSLAQDADSEFYDVDCHSDTSIPTLTSVSDSWDTFEFNFVNPFACDDYLDSDWEEDMEEETAGDTLQSPPDSSSQFRTLDTASLHSFMHVNKITYRNTGPDSLSGENHGDGEEAVVIPVTPFPHPHLLSPIIEEDEDEEEETSDTETIRPSSILLHLH